MNEKFIAALIERGWIEIQEDWEYRKGDWFILRDTGSWWMIVRIDRSRVFDFPEPITTEGWTVNLMEHLCDCDDKLKRK